MSQPEALNPVLEARIDDLFDKDPEQLSEEEFNKIIEYYRDLKASWAAKEVTKATKKDAKVAKTKAEILANIEGQTFDD